MKKKLLLLMTMGFTVAGLTGCIRYTGTTNTVNKELKGTETKVIATTEEPTTEEPTTESGLDLTGYDNVGNVYFLSGDFDYSASQEITGIGTEYVYILNDGETIESFGIISTTPTDFSSNIGFTEDLSPITLKELLKQSIISGYGDTYTSSEFTGGLNRAGTEMTWSLYEYTDIESSGITVKLRCYVYVDDTDVLVVMHLIPSGLEFSGKFEEILRSIIVSGDAQISSGEHFLEYYDGTRVGINDIPGYVLDYESEYFIEYKTADDNVEVTYSFDYDTPQELIDDEIKFYEESMGYTLPKKETGTFANDLGQEYQYLLLNIDTGFSIRYELYFFSAINENLSFSVEIESHEEINIDDYKFLVNSDIVSR